MHPEVAREYDTEAFKELDLKMIGKQVQMYKITKSKDSLRDLNSDDGIYDFESHSSDPEEEESKASINQDTSRSSQSVSDKHGLLKES